MSNPGSTAKDLYRGSQPELLTHIWGCVRGHTSHRGADLLRAPSGSARSHEVLNSHVMPTWRHHIELVKREAKSWKRKLPHSASSSPKTSQGWKLKMKDDKHTTHSITHLCIHWPFTHSFLSASILLYILHGYTILRLCIPNGELRCRLTSLVLNLLLPRQ